MTVIKLNGRMDLGAAKPLARDLSAANGTLRVDAGEVSHLGGLCLELLLSAAQSAQRAGFGFSVNPRSAAFTAALEQFGVADNFLLVEASA